MRDLPSAVLFACTMNSVRSPMAEALLKHLHGKHIFVDSVGARKGEIDSFAVAVMEEIGIDLSRHRSKSFAQLEDSSFDLIVTLSPEAKTTLGTVEDLMEIPIAYVCGIRKDAVALDRSVEELRRSADQVAHVVGH